MKYKCSNCATTVILQEHPKGRKAPCSECKLGTIYYVREGTNPKKYAPRPAPEKRWYVEKTYSCPNCWRRNENPPRRQSDNMPYCSYCLADKSEFVEMSEIKTKVWRKRISKKVDAVPL